MDGYRHAKRDDGFVLDLGSSHPFEPTAATAAAGATIIIVGTGSVTTIDGVWQFGAVNGNERNHQLNGIPVTAGFVSTGGVGGVTPAHGQLFAKGADDVAGGGLYVGLHKKYSVA